MRKMRKTFKRPKSPWNSALIEEEKRLLREFGLKNKKELWKARSILREYRRRARDITANKNKEEEKILLEKLVKFNLLERHQGIDDVLALTVEDILNRRLQTIVFRKNLANTIKQARQFIVHGHIKIAGRKVTFPSYFVPADEEGKIELSPKIKLNAQSQRPQAAPKQQAAPQPAEGASGDKK